MDNFLTKNNIFTVLVEKVNMEMESAGLVIDILS